MLADVHLKTQIFRNVKVSLDKKLNLYKLESQGNPIFVPSSAIQYMVEYPSKSKSKPPKKRKSTSRKRKK